MEFGDLDLALFSLLVDISLSPSVRQSKLRLAWEALGCLPDHALFVHIWVLFDIRVVG